VNLVTLRPADDIVAQLRRLAGHIEAGEVQAQEVVCILRADTNNADVFCWGDYRGQIATLGLIEAAKRRLTVNVQVEDGVL